MAFTSEKIAVIGAGTMGHGIAQVFAMSESQVTLFDASEDSLQTATGKIEKNLQKGVAKGKVEQSLADAAMANLTTSAVLSDAVANADLVIEAIPEDLGLKRKVLSAAEAAAHASTVIATNTSSLSVEKIAEGLVRPHQLIGLHFFNPVHIMKLVEIVQHDKVSQELLEFAQAVVRRIGKTPIVVKDAPGFASSRLGIAIGLEAMRMVEEGVASAHDIDTAMRLGYGFPMGPLELTDLVGLDVRLDIAKYLASTLGPRFEPPQMLARMVEEGALGKKAGRGFYVWVEGKKQLP